MEASAPLSGRQRSSPPAGQGSHRSDFHLREVEGQQVALPRLPVDALAQEKGRQNEKERDWKWQKGGNRQMQNHSDKERLKQGGRWEQGEARRGTEGRDTADRQAEWQTLINTSLWLLFTWVPACFRCYCISPANTAGDVCSRNITGEIWTRAEICRHFLQYQSALNIITVVVILWAWL